MDFVIKFASEHESFRLPEIEALAVLEGVDLKVKEYSTEVRKKAGLFHSTYFFHFYMEFIQLTDMFTRLHFASSNSHP